MCKARCRAALVGLLLMGMVGWSGATVSAPAAASDDVEERIGTYLHDLAEQQHVPGLAAATVAEGEAPREYLLGHDGNGSPVDRDTPFLIGSVAKSMTATLVVKLADDGRLRLGEPVSTYLDWLDDAEPPTLEQLLTHTSGYSALDGMRVSERYDSGPDALRGAAQDLERSGKVGEYSYSSANYLLLGAVVEEVTGRPYAEVLESELLGPLGMDDTSAQAETAEDLPPGHRIWWGQARAYDPGFDESGASFGYVVSTLGDLERYVAAQAGRAPEVLPVDLLERMQSPHTNAADDAYGFGWRIRGDDEDRVVHHTGATPGYFAHVLIGSDGVLVVLLANSYSEARAPALAAAAGDLHAIVRGAAAPAPARGDPLLLAVPWVLAATALTGLAVAVAAWRRPRRRGARRVLAAVAFLVGVALWLMPGLLGVDLRVMRVWFPDAAFALLTGMVTWILVALTLLLGRGSTAAPTPRTRPVAQRAVERPGRGDLRHDVQQDRQQ